MKKTAEQQKAEKFLAGATDLKAHFIKADSINAIRQELTFSILRRYNCYAGCKICYTDKNFEKDKSKFSRYIPDHIPANLEQKWSELFNNYNVISTHDDLYFLKTQHPHLFDWYKRNAKRMFLGSVTDNAFSRSVDIYLDDIDECIGIYDIAFSDQFLEKINFDKLMSKLNALGEKFKIIQIKIIVYSFDRTESERIKKLREWSEKNDIIFTVYHDILDTDTVVFYKPEQELTFASYNGDIFHICGEADYLQYDSFFLTLEDAIRLEIDPYDVLDENFNYKDHTWKHLEGKKDVYHRYYMGIKDSNNEHNKKFAQYYKLISENLEVNPKFNFIPYVVLTNEDKLFYKYINDGWISTDLGLVNPADQQTILPLYRIR